MKALLDRFCHLVTAYLAFWVLLLAFVALWQPHWFHVLRPGYISPLLGVIMFGMGMTLRLQDLSVVLLRPRDVLLGCLAQFTVMPLLAFAIVSLLRLPQDLAVGVILVGCCPGGTSSNVMTFLARGDLALSVAMTTLSTLLAPLLTPLLTLLLAGAYVEVDTLGMFLSILEVVLLPIALGFAFKYFLPGVCERLTAYLPTVSALAIMTIVLTVVSANSSLLLSSGFLVLVSVILHNVMGYLLGYGLGRALGMSGRKCRALSIEVGMQNSGLACSLAQSGFRNLPFATVPGAVFSVWHNISGALLARILSGREK